jgi:hypothetical protein
MQRGEYGDDAPYAMVVFGSLAVILAIYNLGTIGASNVTRRRLGWRFWWGNPFAATTLLTASRPPA